MGIQLEKLFADIQFHPESHILNLTVVRLK